MSASLVGSEMCIRDSSSSAAQHRNLSGSRCLQVQDKDVSPRWPAGTAACLLYTSDAADDM
eukprot:12756496-Alexandrium_andersonii.AAC.1